MALQSHQNRDSFVFDAARALAALAVLLAHARSIVLLDASEQPTLSWPARIFYGFSGLGHQAVIVFFVVSGALVTRSLIVMHEDEKWSGSHFATNRLARLWVVLLPCLLCGGSLDRLGLTLAGPAHVADRYGAPPMNAMAVLAHLDGVTFAGNLLFLQNRMVRSFGSNVPLWTLAIEAWCYVAAFLLFSLWRERRRLPRTMSYGLALAITAILAGTRSFWLLAPIWALGSLVAFSPARWGGPPNRMALRTGLTVFGLTLPAVRILASRYPIASDYALACATAGLLHLLRDCRPAASGTVRATRHVAHISYSLYLSHYPLLAFVAAVILGNRQWSFGAEGLLWLSTLVALALCHAALLWWMFERQTAAVRYAVLGWFDKRSNRSAALARRGGVAP